MGETDINLLVGLLALEAGFIDGAAFAAAMKTWTESKHKSLPEILCEQGSLDESRRSQLYEIVQSHLEKCQGDPAPGPAAEPLAVGWQSELSPADDPRTDDFGSRGSLADLQEVSQSLLTENTLPQTDGALTRDVEAGPAGNYSTGESTSQRGRFRSFRYVDSGGMGDVYLALDEELHRKVALKRLQERFAGNDDMRARFVVEAEVTGRLEHPGVVPVYGLGSDADGRPFYAMRFIQGESLLKAIRRFHSPKTDSGSPQGDTESRAVEFRRLLGSFVDVCHAVHYAHRRGVLHRDLKPANIMLGKYGETLVVDWGLAKIIGRKDATDSSSETTAFPVGDSRDPPDNRGRVGTLPYMSPEQADCQHDTLTSAADVYSLGATLYALLTGKAPCTGKDSGDVLRRVQVGDFPTPRTINHTAPRALEAICLKAMAHRPWDRYTSARALADDIERWLADEPVKAHTETPSQWLVRLARRNSSQRIRDAGVFAVFSSLFHVAWALLGALFVVTGVMETYNPEIRGNEFLLGVAAMVFMFFVPTGIFGWYSMGRHVWALWAGLALSLYGVTFAALWGFWPQLSESFPLLKFGEAYARPFDRNAISALELLLYAVQLGAYLVAIAAYYSNRYSLAWSRHPFRPRRPR